MIAAPLAAGEICLQPFHASTDPGLPRMSVETWPPHSGSVFTFKIGKNIESEVREGQKLTLRDVPSDRKVLLRVFLDGKPFESFRVDLRKPPHRQCLYLYPGYWHWITGCRCK